MTDLFVSYKAEDRPRVQPLVTALQEDGIPLWWDAHIGGGATWRDSIEAELAGARCVIVVWSRRSTGMDGSFVRDEATRALRRGVYLPVRIDAVEPPLGFGETQVLPLIGWGGNRADPRYQAVLQTARAIIDGAARPPGATAAAAQGAGRRVLLVGGAALAAGAASFGVWRAWRGLTPNAAADSVAVLPFANLSGDPAQAYFSDGIAEELRSALSRIVQLKVAARTSSEMMRNTDVPTAASKLGVANIVTGSVRRGADTIRVSAQMIDGASGLERWSESYDRAMGDALAIETGIAESVAKALNIALGRATRALLSAGGTQNAVANDAYLRGQALSRAQKLEAARAAFDEAIAADPNFALARSGRADVIATQASNALGGAALRTALAEAEAEARRAIALAPGLGRPRAVLGVVLLIGLDLRGAAAALTIAYRQEPGDTMVLSRYALLQSTIGHAEQAITLAHQAQALDPMRNGGRGELGLAFLRAGRIDDAIATFRQSIAMGLDAPITRALLGYALVLKGKPAEALQVIANIPADSSFLLTARAMATAHLGDRAASDRALDAVERLGGADYQIAEIHAQRGEIDAAFLALGRAYDMTDPGLLNVKTDPLLAPLRADPRFAALESKIGFP